MPSDQRNIAHRLSEARRLMDEPLLNEALDRIERLAFEEALRLPREDDDGRRLMLDYVKVIRGIRAHLQAVILNSETVLRPPLKVA